MKLVFLLACGLQLFFSQLLLASSIHLVQAAPREEEVPNAPAAVAWPPEIQRLHALVTSAVNENPDQSKPIASGDYVAVCYFAMEERRQDTTTPDKPGVVPVSDDDLRDNEWKKTVTCRKVRKIAADAFVDSKGHIELKGESLTFNRQKIEFVRELGTWGYDIPDTRPLTATTTPII